MSVSFEQTLQGMTADSARPTLLLWGAAAVGVLAWAGWFGTASITLYESAHAGQVVSAGVARRIAVPDGGSVTQLNVSLGQRVMAGEPLVVFDATAQQLALADGEQQLLVLSDRLARIETELTAREEALADAKRAAEAAVAVAQTASDETLAALDFARGRLTRMETLHKNGGASAAELDKARADLAALEAQQKGKVSEVLRQGLVATSDAHRAQADIESLQGSRAEIAVQVTHARTTVALLQRAADRATLTAATDGVVGDLAPIGVGSTLAAGDYVLTLVPDGEQQIEAAFDASTALGALKVGEAATVTRTGGADHRRYHAHVVAVGAEPVDGMVRAQLQLDDTDAALVHGQSVSVDVATRSVTPFGLVAAMLGLQSP